MRKINENDILSLGFLTAILTLLVTLLSISSVFLWNWITASLGWSIKLNFWLIFSILEILGLVFIFIMHFKEKTWTEEHAGWYNEELTGPDYHDDFDDPYDY